VLAREFSRRIRKRGLKMGNHALMRARCGIRSFDGIPDSAIASKVQLPKIHSRLELCRLPKCPLGGEPFAVTLGYWRQSIREPHHSDGDRLAQAGQPLDVSCT
jgi:hypothetical protein